MQQGMMNCSNQLDSTSVHPTISIGDVGKVRANHILVENHSQAQDLIGRIDSGEDFAKIAKDYSTCPSKKEEV